MSLIYKRSRQLAKEIDETAAKLGYGLKARPIETPDMQFERDCRRELYAPDGTLIAKVTKQPIGRTSLQKAPRHPVPVCNMKDCYCRQFNNNVTHPERDRTPSKTKNRVTWDQILSQHAPDDGGLHAQKRSHEVNNDKPIVKARDGPSEHQHGYDIDPVSFVDGVARQNPGDLLKMRAEIDRAARRLGLDEYFPLEPSKEKKKSLQITRDFLEGHLDLVVETLKKQVVDSESRYEQMRQKLEDALVAQKLEIQNLRSELFSKNEEVAALRRNQQTTSPQQESLQKELEFVRRVTSLDERLKAMMEKDELSNVKLDKCEQTISELRAKLSDVSHNAELYKAKMEIYQMERDQAIASVSVYQTKLNRLKKDLLDEVHGLRPCLDLTADSRGTLNTTNREPHDIVTSSPNSSLRHPWDLEEAEESPKERRAEPKKRTKLTLTEDSTPDYPASNPIANENVGAALLRQLEVLGREFKQFSQNVLPLALGLDDEAKQLLNASSSTELSCSDSQPQSISSITSQASSR